MRLQIFRIMLLSLWRDPAALAMSFVLPGIVFATFAVIFSGASGGELAIRVAVADFRSDDSSRKLVRSVFENQKLVRSEQSFSSDEEIVAVVRSGKADVGLIIRRQDGPLVQPQSGDSRHFEVLVDPSKEIASSMLQGSLQTALLGLLPAGTRPEKPFDIRSAMTSEGGFTAVTYYAGAVAMMFLLFSSITGASTYLEERDTGLLDRISSGLGGMAVVVDGKFIFLVVHGVLQVAFVFLVGWAIWDLDLPGKLLLWSIATISAAVSAAGLALAFVTVCQTKKQAETTGQMIVLILSAIGGSMVPRFLMPEEVQWLGWFTPNSWALEAYASIFWRGDEAIAIAVPCAVLLSMGLAGLMIAHRVASRHGVRSSE